MKIKLEHVHYMPKELNSGVLYVSKEFKTAAHLCACGCGAKIRTPLTSTEWSLEETKSGPTLRPSIGNWQQKCQSHYWIYHGEIRWDDMWSPEQISAGRSGENERRRIYYEALNHQRNRIIQRFYQWVKGFFN